jgi:glycosyltransferase involved in cell wall biosynthesis
MKSHTRLTVAIVALNEARNLAELLPTLDWADETLVVDGGSRDGSAMIAQRLSARVLVRHFDNFAAQRNFALEHSRGDWVLMVDADERPTPRLIRELRQLIHTEKHAAFHVPIRSNIFGRAMRYSGTQDDRPVRLVRCDAARWHGAVHERCVVQGRVGRLRNALQHRTMPNVEAFLDKMHRYTRLEAEARVARQESPRWTDAWVAPPRELFRRLVWKLGVFDGPEGWAFCALSGLSEWVLAREHARLWRVAKTAETHSMDRIPSLLAQGGLA